MSKFNLRILLAIVVGIIQVVVKVLSGDIPDNTIEDYDINSNGGS